MARGSWGDVLTNLITFLPSGRSCEIEAHETILAAALRAGLAPDYGCSIGNCGSCMARLVSGEVEQVSHSDHALRASDRAAGHFLMCANRALGSIEVEADVTQGPEDIPAQRIEVRIRALDRLDPQIIRLHVQTPRSQRLRFISGQSVTLATATGDSCTMPIASCPCDDRNILFHVPDIPGDRFCEAVFSGAVSARDTLHLAGPLPGAFHLDAALLHKSGAERSSPFPGRTYPTATVTGMPSAV